MSRASRARASIVGLALVAATFSPLTSGAAAAASGAVIVQGPNAAATAVAVERVGGRVDTVLGIVDGVAAHVDAGDAAQLQAMGLRVVPDAAMKPTGAYYTTGTVGSAREAMHLTSDTVDAGNGVGVALIDTGVQASDNDIWHVVDGTDFTDSHNSLHDGYGHGTFMAGLIAGVDTGVAPSASVVSVKVADDSGTTTLSTVIQGIGWAVTHRDAYRIGVINLSFALEAPMPYQSNPLDAAVEAAWASNITVVTAAGNNGSTVTSPGDDPYVVTVGSLDDNGAVWSQSGRQNFRGYSKPEVYAPGLSVVSLRAAGSAIDTANPGAVVDGKYFRGTGTSMSTALVAGAAAVLRSHHPSAKPDDIKAALVNGSPAQAGVKAVSVQGADQWEPTTQPTWQTYKLAYGNLGFPELNKGMPWQQKGAWSAGSWTAGSWTAGSWTAGAWTAGSWTAGAWTAGAWTAGAWTAGAWTAGAWTAGAWTAGAWTAGAWTAGAWTAAAWT